MAHSPEVSVIIPVYERLDLALLSVEAVFAQREVACQVIVVDDGSAADTTALSAYVNSRGGQFISQPHGGIAAARNAGLDFAACPWVAFVDSDDVVYPTKLAMQIDALMSHSAVWSCTGFDLLSPDGETIGGENLCALRDRFLEYSCPFGSTSVLVSRDAVKDLGGFDVQFVRSEDWDLFIRLHRMSRPVVLTDRLYGYRLSCGNVTGRDPEQWLRAWEMLCAKHDIRPEPGAYLSIVNSLPKVPGRFLTNDLGARFSGAAL